MAESGADGRKKGERKDISIGLQMGQITIWFACLARIIINCRKILRTRRKTD